MSREARTIPTLWIDTPDTGTQRIERVYIRKREGPARTISRCVVAVSASLERSLCRSTTMTTQLFQCFSTTSHISLWRPWLPLRSELLQEDHCSYILFGRWLSLVNSRCRCLTVARHSLSRSHQRPLPILPANHRHCLQPSNISMKTGTEFGLHWCAQFPADDPWWVSLHGLIILDY